MVSKNDLQAMMLDTMQDYFRLICEMDDANEFETAKDLYFDMNRKQRADFTDWYSESGWADGNFVERVEQI